VKLIDFLKYIHLFKRRQIWIFGLMFVKLNNHKKNGLRYRTINILNWCGNNVLPINYAPLLVTHGLMTETTMITTTMRSIMMAIHIHFLEFLCIFFAFWRELLPCCTWSTALETWIWSQMSLINQISHFYDNFGEYFSPYQRLFWPTTETFEDGINTFRFLRTR